MKSRRLFLILADIIFVNVTFLLALYLHYEGQVPKGYISAYLLLGIISTIAKILIYRYYQLYSSIWEYASIEELIKVVQAVLVGNVIGIIYYTTAGFHMYFGVYVFAIFLEITCIGGIRFSYRIVRRLNMRQSLTTQQVLKKILIVGTGSTATLIAAEIKNHPEVHGNLVGFVDDDPIKFKKTIAGVKVLGNSNDIYSIVKRYDVTEIILAIPTMNKELMKVIVNECKRTEVKVRILPGVREIIDGQVSMNKVRDVEIEDLLGRDPVNLNVVEIAGYIEGNVIMITGGGGSIGSELCRQIVRFEPKKLIILDIYENNAYEIQGELKRDYPNLDLDVVIASVRDRNTVFDIVEELRPDVIFHAAAHKHVPLMERTPKEAVKNNTFGTMNMAEAADQFGVKYFVLISTDKAVNPTNIMGASKRMCEMVIQGLSKTHTKTKFVAVRFGNVLGSNGSVIPLFKQQIKEGGPVTLTHKEIIRYFMTIPEAAQLVIQAGAIASGGEIFVLDMGEPVKIYDLAIDLIRLSGFKPFEDIDIEIVGLRPGEKLYEELLMEDEGIKETKYEKIHIGMPSESDYKVLKQSFIELNNVIQNGSDDEFVELVKRVVPTYRDNFVVNNERKHLMESVDKYRAVEL